MTKVYAPNERFTGSRAGIAFSNGVGELDAKDEKARAFFERHGYGIGEKPAPEPSAADAYAAARTAPHHPAARLRDAAVDPEPRDFLPPTNAGEEDPHGPLVVAPEIHHEGPKGIRPGDVHVDDAEVQGAAETALAHRILVDREPHDEVVADFAGDGKDGSDDRPARSASKADWVEFAVSKGADREEAEAETRATLIDRYGGEG